MAQRSDRPPLEAAKLQAPLVRMLRPLVRLLIRSGLTFPTLVDLLRELYVNVAEYDFTLPDKVQTDSRVSLLTGIHRKEVARLRGAGAPVSVVPAALSRTSKIIAHWLASPEYTDRQGRPRPLWRGGKDKGEPSFETLVASVTRDVHPRAVLDEWIDRNLVTTDAQGRIVLVEAGFIPTADTEQQLYYFGRNLHDHVAACVANVLSNQPPFLERAVHYDGLSEELAKSLEQQSRTRAMSLLQEMNKTAHNACETDKGGNWRWNLGVYVFREEVAEEPEDPSDTPAE